MKRMKFCLLVFFVFFCIHSLAFAGEIDLLLQKLVEKGVLTAGEASQIKTETQEQVKKEIASGKYSSLPQWVQNIKLKGDFRLRYQLNHSKSVNNRSVERHRARMRLRFGAESKVNEKLLVALGLATGVNDGASGFSHDAIRSTNQSFDNTFAKHTFNLDYAYVKYMATPWMTLFGGKILLKDALWEPGDLVWDTDITPEGGAFILEKKLGTFNTMLHTGFYIFEEESTKGADPWFVHIQPIVSTKLGEAISLKTAVALDWFNVGRATLNGSGKSNSWSTSANTTTPPKDIFNIMPAVELKINEPFKPLNVRLLDNISTVKLFGEYVRNMSKTFKPDDNKSGYMLGMSLGADKVEKWGDWQLSYNFARLEKDAVLDVLPDSDRYGGATNIRGHEWKLAFGLGKNTSLDFDIYRIQKLSKPYAPETLVQVDWNMKF